MPCKSATVPAAVSSIFPRGELFRHNCHWCRLMPGRRRNRDESEDLPLHNRFTPTENGGRVLFYNSHFSYKIFLR